MSKTKAHFSAQKAAFPQAQLPSTQTFNDPAPTPMAPPQPFEFAARPNTVMPYQTPPRVPGSGTGAQNAFASQRGFDPVQSFLSSLPELGSTTPPDYSVKPTHPIPVMDTIPVPQTAAATPAEQMGTNHPLYQAILRKYGGGGV